VNRDIVPHTVTADARQFDSASVSPSAEWSFVARERGRIPYTCTFHPTMKGVLVVK
jgi:plastocyanin